MSEFLAGVTATLADLDPLRLAGIMLAILTAAVVKGSVGFGFPLVATPIVSTFWDARHAVLVISLASVMNNLGITLRGGGSRQTFRRFVPTLGGLIGGTIVGSLLLARVDPRILAVAVGTAAAVFGLVALVKPNLAVPPRLERYLALPMGIFGGLLGGSTGIFAPALASYTHALKLSKREFVFFLNMLYFVGSGVQVLSYTQLGLYDATIIIVGLLTVIPNYAGVSIGLWLQDRIDQTLFRRLVIVVIMVSGTSLVVRGLWR